MFRFLFDDCGLSAHLSEDTIRWLMRAIMRPQWVVKYNLGKQIIELANVIRYGILKIDKPMANLIDNLED